LYIEAPNAWATEMRSSVYPSAGALAGLRADDPSGAALVVDDDLPAQALGKLEGDHAPDDVVAAAGWKRNDHAHRLARIRLRGCVRRIQRCGGG